MLDTNFHHVSIEFSKMLCCSTLHQLLDFQEKKKSMDFVYYFLVVLNLKCHPFIGKRSEMLGKEGHGILQFEVALKGKKGILP